jgi:hypothetical protein
MNKLEEIFKAWNISFNPDDSQAELAGKRIEICNSCEFKTTTLGINRCSVCGCALKGKVFSPVKGACPKGKWDEVDGLDTNSFILLSHWNGRFGNRMHQYAYGAMYAHLNNVPFVLTADWEGTHLFKNQLHTICDNDEVRLYRNQTNNTFHTHESQKSILEKHYPQIRKISPDTAPENYSKQSHPVYFDSVCAYSQAIFEPMTKEFLLNIFEFSDKVKNTEAYKYWESKKGTYDIAHLRRDDISNISYNNTNVQGYSVISRESYLKAFEKFGFNPDEVVWTSDDYTNKWHTDRPPGVRLGWKYPEGSQYRADIIFDWLEDFLRLYFARTIFRANSSFSWWASFLSPTAKIYSPVLDKQVIYGRGNDGVEIDVDFVEGNHPHWMYGLKDIIIK